MVKKLLALTLALLLVAGVVALGTDFDIGLSAGGPYSSISGVPAPTYKLRFDFNQGFAEVPFNRQSGIDSFTIGGKAFLSDDQIAYLDFGGIFSLIGPQGFRPTGFRVGAGGQLRIEPGVFRGEANLVNPNWMDPAGSYLEIALGLQYDLATIFETETTETTGG